MHEKVEAITIQPFKNVDGVTVINIPSDSQFDKLLRSTERLYVRDGLCSKDKFFPHPTDFEITNELGGIIFRASFVLGATENKYGPVGYIRSIKIVDLHGIEIIRGDLNKLVSFKADYDIRAIIGRRCFTLSRRYFSNGYDLRETTNEPDGEISFTISSNTTTCAFACCCSFCATKFDVYQNDEYNHKKSISEMHIKWNGAINAYVLWNLPITSTDNSRHFTESKWCFGQKCGGLRLGMWGCSNLGSCAIIWLSFIIATVLTLVLIFTLD